MFCPNCGKDAGESKFCPECGAKVEVVKKAEEAKADENKLNYDDVKNANLEVAEKVESKRSKKKLIGCLSPFIIIILIVAGVFGYFKIKSMGPADKINFDVLESDYKENATSAKEDYYGKKFEFYFIPGKIESSGYCKGSLYDSDGNAYDYDCSLLFGKDAEMLEKGTTYQIEGLFYPNYDDDRTSSKFWGTTISSITIVDEDVEIPEND